MTPGAGAPGRARLPAAIWALGLVSLFMDVSSEMIHALLPVFLVTGLGASAFMVGLIEGIGEAVAAFAKVGSGWLSDRLRNRKRLTALGYGLSALTKPLFAMAGSAGFVLGARVADRLGKGIRGAPRDALIADLTPEPARGAAYGLRQSLDTAGAVFGPILGIALMVVLAGDIRGVFWVSFVPALVAVLLLLVFVREPDRPRAQGPEAAPAPGLAWSDLKALGRPYWKVVALAACFSVARFSEAFLVLRAEGLGLALALVPLVFIVMNTVYALSAYPVGRLSDAVGRYGLLVAGFGVLILADLILAAAEGLGAAFAGIALWGLHLGLTQGLLAALVSDSVAPAARGTAFGLFHLISGAALLAGGAWAGLLWTWIGPSATFASGAAICAGALALGVVVLRGASRP